MLCEHRSVITKLWVVNTGLVTNPKHSTSGTARREINSIPAKTRAPSKKDNG